MSLSKILKRTLNSKYKVMHEAGYLNDELKLTPDGILALNHVLVEKFEDELAAAAQDLLDRQEKNK